MKEDDNLLNGGSVACLSSILSGFVPPAMLMPPAVADTILSGLSRPQMKEEKKFSNWKHGPTRSRRISRCMTFDLVQEVSARAMFRKHDEAPLCDA